MRIIPRIRGFVTDFVKKQYTEHVRDREKKKHAGGSDPILVRYPRNQASCLFCEKQEKNIASVTHYNYWFYAF